MKELITEDPNYLAYKAAQEKGEFDHLAPDSWLAFREGFLIYTAPNKEEVLKFLQSLDEAKSTFITQVRPEVIEMSGFFADADGMLHRGIPTWFEGEDGEKVPVFLEWGTLTAFPRTEE